jgi:hypothetical protein
MLKVLYVSAWGRSGTTIVDNVLNGYPGVFSAGELRYVWRRGLIAKQSCGCGAPVRECPLWRDVLKVAFGDALPNAREVVAMQRRITRARRTPSLLRRDWPDEARTYADLMARLYRAIGEVTGASLVVDSSKLPSEAAMLARRPDLETYLLHMVRDPRGVAYSWSRQKLHPDRGTFMLQHGPAKSTVNWLAWNALAGLVSRHYDGRFRLLRYEDLVADPRGQIESLLDLVGIPTADGPFLDRRTVRLTPNHTVSGNPGRFSVGDIEIRDDDRWRAEQPLRQRLTASTLALPMSIRYRYPVFPRPRPEPAPRPGSIVPPRPRDADERSAHQEAP